MGGYGSGTRYGRSTKPKAETLCRLSVNDLNRTRTLRLGASRYMLWSSEERYYSAMVYGFDYEIHIEFDDNRQTVPIVWTHCHYGGRRPWFLCPSCHERVGMLYRRHESFKCRHCHRVTYRSRIYDRYQRNMVKSDRLERRLVYRNGLYYKPKGMHWKTFDRIYNAMIAADRESFYVPKVLARKLGFED